MSAQILKASATAERLIARARRRHYRQQIFQAMRRKLHWAMLFLIFTREAWGAETDLIASPVFSLLHAPTPALLSLAAMLGYLLAAAVWFSWQRPFILGGEFRRYLASLPLDSAQSLRLDRRQIRSASLLLMLPQMLATLMALHHRPSLATLADLLTALTATVLLIWQLGEAVVWRKRTMLALCLLVGSLLAAGALLPLGLRVAERCLLAGLPWLLPAVLAGRRSRRVEQQPAAPFILLPALRALCLLPWAVLWRANRSALLARTAIAAASLALVSYAVLAAAMADRALGFAVSAAAFSLWVLAGLYDILAAARSTVRYWSALPLPHWRSAAGELLTVCGLGALLIALFLLLPLHALLPHPLLFGLAAVVQLALLWQIGAVPVEWRNVSMLLVLLAWSLALWNLL
jgi:hypothetical protein